MKKILAVLCVLSLLCTLFVSCGPEEQTLPTDASSEESRQTETPTEVVTENPIGAPYDKPTAQTKITESNITTKFKKQTYTDSVTGNELKVRFRLPDGYNPEGSYPVLIFLHGAGQRGSDNSAQITYSFYNLFADLNSPAYGAIVIAPQCPTDKQWVNTPWTDNYDLNQVPLSEMLHSVMDYLEYVKETCAVDTDRIYIMGLSMGGYGTWDLIERYPDVFAAALPMCGGGSPTTVESIKNMPITTVHGDSDTTVPTQRSRDMVAALEAVGNHVDYHELAGYKHNVWDWTMTNSQIIAWLFAQSK